MTTAAEAKAELARRAAASSGQPTQSGPTRAQAVAELQRRQKAPPPPLAATELEPEQPSTSLLRQSMSGVNTGLANLLGTPVALAQGVANLPARAINFAAGTDIPLIDNAIGGPQQFGDAMRAVDSNYDVAPQTTAQRYSRRIGEEIGASAVPMLGATGRMANEGGKALAKAYALSTASDVGAGSAGQLARDMAPDRPWVEALASLAGGGVPLGVSRINEPSSGPTIEQLRAQKDAAYKLVDGSPVTLTTDAVDEFAGIVQRNILSEGALLDLPPEIRQAYTRVGRLGNTRPATISEIDDFRKVVSSDIAGNMASANTSRIGQGLVRDIDEYLDGIQPNRLTGGTAQETAQTIDNLVEARRLNRIVAQSDGLMGDTGAVSKAVRRAESSATGGNEVNAIRQNIRSILDSPAKRRQYSAAQLAQMDDIVSGNKVTNSMRWMANNFSPTRGALPMATAGGATALGATVNPAFYALPVGGLLSQVGSEALTQMQTRRLDDFIRNSDKVVSNLTPAQRAAQNAFGPAALAGLLSQEPQE